MNTQRRIFSILTFSLVFLISTVSLSAQGDPSKVAEANYEAVLHVLVSSNQPGSSDLPSSLSNVAKQVRSEFGGPSLKLINTYLGRLSNAGALEYKGVSNAYVQEAETGAPSFLDWSLSGMRITQNAAGQDIYQFQNFRFGARVPVRITPVSGDGPKPSVINYESTGLTLQRMGVRENTPTLLGTLTQPKTDGTLFLILTVKNADK